GVEHAILHLMYARFFTKAMRDLGLVDYDEPFVRLRNQGIILGEDNEKMSKSRGNVVDPDDLVAELGADVVRLYLMFIGPWEQGGPWNSRGISGIERFVRRVWSLVQETADNPAPEDASADARELRQITHRTIKAVTEDIENFRFNTMIARLMELQNELAPRKETPVVSTKAWREALESMTLMLAPIAPHLAEELWQRLGQPYSVHQQLWPTFDAELVREELIELPVQVNGKVRDHLEVPVDISEERAVEQALASPRVAEITTGKQVQRVVYVPRRLINIVAR
ncbi:MAG TPA: class I tRNA ligase family protein, partial [Thermomicrobiaceae bacterium]|nr:class I tRNA ligase family protein [Thermomicrobiaceae bacterium]